MSMWDDALCTGTAQPRKPNGDAVDWFFDTYEKDAAVREQVRELCNSCPIQRGCRYYGETNKMTGVWGGVYLDNGIESEDKFE